MCCKHLFWLNKQHLFKNILPLCKALKMMQNLAPSFTFVTQWVALRFWHFSQKFQTTMRYLMRAFWWPRRPSWDAAAPVTLPAWPLYSNPSWAIKSCEDTGIPGLGGFEWAVKTISAGARPRGCSRWAPTNSTWQCYRSFTTISVMDPPQKSSTIFHK